MASPNAYKIPVTFRTATDDDIAIMLDWWKPILSDIYTYDTDAWIEIDPGCIITAINADGEPVGFGGSCIQSDEIAYLMTYIVREDLRRQDIGRQLADVLLDRAGHRNCAIDGVLSMVPWYEKKGFVHKTFTIKCYYIIITDEMKTKPPTTYDIQPLTDKHWPGILEYDKQIYPTIDRERNLRVWFLSTKTRAVVAIDKHGNLVGFGSIHLKSGKEFSMRMVYADNEGVVEAIMRGLFADVPIGSKVIFKKLAEKPLPNYIKGAVDCEVSTLRMYNRFCVRTNTEKMWFLSFSDV